MKKTATAVMIGSLAATLVACGPSEEFKAQCKDAGGQVKLESEVGSIFSMDTVGFEVAPPPPRPPAPVRVPAVVIPKTPPKVPSNRSNVDVPDVAIPNAAGKGKGSKGRSSSDDDYVCVKGDKVLFEED